MSQYSHAVETRIENATRVLAHYFKGSANDNEDMRAEIRGVVESIIGAAILEVAGAAEEVMGRGR